jgi:tetratricopeptide (TPR) repeat protein
MTFYELLEVQPTADEQTVKRAWARLVRLHPPDKDPETNQRLNEAKQTLLDSVARADYDARLLFGDEIDELFEIADECMSEEDYDKAIRCFKEILALHPKCFDARNKLALAYAYNEDYAEAIRQYDRLTSEAPTSALYAANYGHVLRRANRNRDAERWFKKAIELESFNAEHHLSLARLYVHEDRFTEAEAAIESAIAADGQTDIGDIDAMMELTWVYLFSNRKEKVPSVAERIAAILPDDPEARLYASFNFLRTAAELIAEYRNFQDAEIFIKAARKIDNDFGDARESVERMELYAKADREADRMKDDTSVHPQVVPALIAFNVHSRLGFEFQEAYGDHLIEATATWPQSEIRSAIHMCQSRYPNACRVVSDVLPTIIDLGIAGYVPSRPSSAASSGGCILPIALSLCAFALALASIL